MLDFIYFVLSSCEVVSCCSDDGSRSKTLGFKTESLNPKAYSFLSVMIVYIVKHKYKQKLIPNLQNHILVILQCVGHTLKIYIFLYQIWKCYSKFYHIVCTYISFIMC